MTARISRTILSFAATIIIPSASIAQVDLKEACHALSLGEERLSCYDDATGYEPTAEEPNTPVTAQEVEPIVDDGEQWRFTNEKSALDGREDVWLSVTSQNTQPNQIGQTSRATFWVRCMQNKTNAFVLFNTYTSDDQTVRYRFDEESVKSIWMETMTGGEGIGVWSGGRAIPFIKDIFGKNELIIGYSSYSNNNLEFTFDVSGLRARIEPLAENCQWQP